MAESAEKQRRFITDAGHEIKTHLAIIQADVSVLELEHPAKMTIFSLSELAEHAVSSFRSLAISQEKTFTTRIAPRNHYIYIRTARKKAPSGAYEYGRAHRSC